LLALVSTPPNDALLIRQLAEKVETELRRLDDGQQYALVDFPDYSNVGDSLLWLGARRALERTTGRAPAYVCSQFSYNAQDLARAVPAGTIYIQGGGNFGDLYPTHQLFREELMKRFPQLHIVQLPQSVDFREASALERTRSAIGTHGNVTLMTRDPVSFARAQELGARALHLTPDIAFCFGATARIRSPNVQRLALSRHDEERTNDRRIFTQSISEHFDWVDFDASDSIVSILMHVSKRPKFWRSLPARVHTSVFDLTAARRVRYGFSNLSRGRVVATDRLHGHIMCVLAGIPHEVADTSFGKIRPFVDAWTGAASSLLRASWRDPT
jgi:pyruvyl transferase EpsO